MAKRLALLALLAAGMLVAVPGPHDVAQAAFPGSNGRIAFVRYPVGGGILEEIFLVNPGVALSVNLTKRPMTSDVAPAWSPDGSQVALHRSGPIAGIWTMGPAGGKLAFVPHSDNGYSPAWSPDGDWIVFSRDDGNDAELWAVRSDGTDLVQLTNNVQDDREAAWSPDGKRIAFSREGPGASTNLWVLRLDGGGELPVTPAGGADGAPDWSPDGKRLAFNRFLPGEGNRIFTVAPSGKALEQVTFGGPSDTHPAWSPDGSRIVFARGGDQDDGLPINLFTVAAGGGATTQVTFGAVVDLMPSWQPL